MCMFALWQIEKKFLKNSVHLTKKAYIMIQTGIPNSISLSPFLLLPFWSTKPPLEFPV